MPRAERLSLPWVRDFYAVWTEFVTSKGFEWVGKWDVERGDDRGIRRLMEKENKKVREDYRREYNDAVRVSWILMALTQKLALFIQNRDPRYKSYLKTQAQRKSAAKVAPAQPIPAARAPSPTDDFEEQDWQRLRHSSDEEGSENEGEEEALECVACAKTFLSEASWANHERSKKHKQAVHR